MQLRFFAALALAGEGEWDEAVTLFREAIAAEPRWEQALPRLAPAGRVSPELVAEVQSRLGAQGVPN